MTTFTGRARAVVDTGIALRQCHEIKERAPTPVNVFEATDSARTSDQTPRALASAGAPQTPLAAPAFSYGPAHGTHRAVAAQAAGAG